MWNINSFLDRLRMKTAVPIRQYCFTKMRQTMSWSRILITGASSGLGWALAVELARPGTVLMLSGRDEKRLSQLAVLVQERGATALVCAADLSSQHGQEGLIEIIDREAPDLLIHSAGLGAYGRFVDTELERSLEIIQVNVLAIVALTHAWCRRLMKACLPGKVIVISSIAGFLPIPSMATYAASKACLTNLAEGLRFELKASGIKVLTVCPGHFATNFQLRAAGRTVTDPASPAAFKVARAIIRVMDREGIYVPMPWKALLPLRWFIPTRWLMSFLEHRVVANLDTPT
jgi:short-subunit dehydrogenase